MNRTIRMAQTRERERERERERNKNIERENMCADDVPNFAEYPYKLGDRPNVEKLEASTSCLVQASAGLHFMSCASHVRPSFFSLCVSPFLLSASLPARDTILASMRRTLCCCGSLHLSNPSRTISRSDLPSSYSSPLAYLFSRTGLRAHLQGVVRAYWWPEDLSA